MIPLTVIIVVGSILCCICIPLCFYFVFVKRRLENLGKIQPTSYKSRKKRERLYLSSRSYQDNHADIRKGLNKRDRRKWNLIFVERRIQQESDENPFLQLFRVKTYPEDEHDAHHGGKKRKKQRVDTEVACSEYNTHDNNNLDNQDNESSLTPTKKEIYSRRLATNWNDKGEQQALEVARANVGLADEVEVIPPPALDLSLLSKQELCLYKRKKAREEAKQLMKENGVVDVVVCNSGPPADRIPEGYQIVGLPPSLDCEEIKGYVIMYYWREKGIEGWYEGIFLGPSRRKEGNYHIRFDKDVTGQLHVDGITKVDLAFNGPHGYGVEWVLLEPIPP